MSMHIPARLHNLHLAMYLATVAMPSLEHSGCCNFDTPLVEATLVTAGRYTISLDRNGCCNFDTLPVEESFVTVGGCTMVE